MEKILKIAKRAWIKKLELEFYWDYKAKISSNIFKRIKNNKDWKLILVTAINPTPAWEGKTTTTIWLWQAFHLLKKKSLICLREPSLWPVMWLKWWATWWWESVIMPSDEINLHFTWDIHAITSAHLLISAALDNHIFQWNDLSVDEKNILWKRAADVNDRALRNISYSSDWKWENQIQNGFIISTASELMAILCLSEDINDLKIRIGNIILAYNLDWNPIFVKDLKIVWAVSALLKDAIKPNIVQTKEWSPCIIHWWPFANIAHWCSSLIATKMALKLSDYVITEAGFWSDLWAEKFFNIKSRIWNLNPDLVVLVATIRALKYNWGQNLKNISEKNLENLEKGFPNLEKHIENMKTFGMDLVVSINIFDTDHEEEILFLKNKCEELWVDVELSYGFSKWWEWMKKIAKKIIKKLDNNNSKYKKLYEDNLNIEEKIKKNVEKIYGGENLIFTKKAIDSIDKITQMWYSNLPICVAKTPVSISDNPKLLARPKWFDFNVRDVYVSAWAGFIVVKAWTVLQMPWLWKTPNYERIDLDKSWIITWIN